MRIAEININNPEQAVKEIIAFCDIGFIAHKELKESSLTSGYKFPIGMGKEFTVDIKSMCDGIAKGRIRAFLIYDESNTVVGYSIWMIGYGMWNIGYKTAALAAIYVPKELRHSGETMRKMLYFSSETLKREGFDTLVVTNENTVFDKAISKMGLELNAKEYRI